MMTEAMQRRYIMLLCMRCSNGLVTLHDEEIAFQLRISAEEMAETKALFIKKGFVDSDWNMLNWDKRQFVSDTSNARVAKHRALQKEKQKEVCNIDVTLQKQKANALDTDTDTDTDKERDKSLSSTSQPRPEPAGFVDFWETWPKSSRKAGRSKCLDVWKRAGIEKQAEQVIAHVLAMKATNDWQKDSGQFVPAPLVYLNGKRWDGAEIGEVGQSDLMAGVI